MAVKIRMQRHGSKKRPFYFIVAANSTSPRDGKFIEKLGTYNPLTVPATVNLDRERALDWLQKGAQPTNTVRKILSFKGVLFMKHLQRGVSLGLFDDAVAKEKFEKWMSDHEQLVSSREEANRQGKKDKTAKATQESVRLIEEKLAAKKAIEDEKAETLRLEEEKIAQEKAAEEAAKAEAEAPKVEAEEVSETEADPKAETKEETKTEEDPSTKEG